MPCSRSKTRRFARLDGSEQNVPGGDLRELQDITNPQTNTTVGAPTPPGANEDSGKSSSIGSNEEEKVETTDIDTTREEKDDGSSDGEPDVHGKVLPPAGFLTPPIAEDDGSTVSEKTHLCEEDRSIASANSSPATSAESFDWNSFWMLLYGVIFSLGYDASLRGTYAYGIEDANRNANTYNTCMNPEKTANNFGLGKDVAYKLSPPIVTTWMLFFILLFVTVRRKRDPWLLSSYFNCRGPSQHSWGVKLGLTFLFLQCIRFTLDVVLNGWSTVKQALSSAITVSLAMMVFFFTLHVLQVDIHRENKSRFHQHKAEVPHNYMWCVFCLIMYWSCGFSMYINSGGASQSEPFITGFSIESVGIVTLYFILHAAVWLVFLLTTWLRKDIIFGTVAS